MKRIIIAVILVLSLVLTSSNSINMPQGLPSTFQQAPNSPEGINLQAEAQGPGNNVPTVQYMDRIITEQILSISNNYGNTSTHSASIDLSSYQLPGWTLFEVQVDVDNITAIAERDVLGVSNEHDVFKIEEYNDLSDWRYNSLTQGFYMKPHNGQLLNYSFYYNSPIYTPAQHGWAYYSILSNYQVASTNLVAYSQLPTRVISGAGWENATVASVNLNANTEYYAVINGSALVETTFFPDIRWVAEIAAGSFTTEQYDSRFSLWGDFPSEALLNYTYIPWNTTTNAALVFSNPSSIALNLSGTPVSGSTWTTNSVNNITTVEISTNQSVSIFHNFTLSYKKDVTANTLWNAESSSSTIMWNATIDLVYPFVPETVIQFMNITNIPLDWNATGLYLGTSPGGSYSKIGSNVTCNALSDGTWTLTSTAPNYAVDLALSDSSDSSPIISEVANLVIMNISATIEDGNGTLQTGGATNLSVLQSSNLIYSPVEIPANSSGMAGFQWDISSTTDGNSTHSIEVYWISTDGLEAGYITQDVFVYHSTTLVADDLSIDDFTEDSFNIGINFDKISPAQGLDAIPANVTYSFGSTVNASMNDDGGGRWTETVFTTGMENGLYPLTVYAEGFALENQSLVITVNLDHHTVTLNWSWSNGNNIAYLESTNLSVTYQLNNGTRIDNAIVNVTFESQTYDMTWNPISENYWIELHGVNFNGVPDNFTLVVNAWKVGFESQYNDTNWIYVQSTSGVDFSAEYSPGLNILYIESMTISVMYNFSSTPIPNATVYVTFDGINPRNLTYNPISQKWEIILLGSDYLGTQTINVTAMSNGYDTEFEVQTFIVQEDTPILSSSWTGNSSTTDYATFASLTITITYSNGTPITNAVVSFTAFSIFYTLSSGPGGLYAFNIDPTDTPGVESFNVSVTGTGILSGEIVLNLTVEATTTIDVVHFATEYEEWNLTVTVTYEDSVSSEPIANASVTMTLDGTVYVLGYSAGVYTIEITLEASPGTYTIDVSASAQYAVTATSQTPFTVDPKDLVYIEITFEGNLVAGQFMEIRATLKSSDTNDTIPGETIRFEVSVYFDNSTVIHYTEGTMTDTTNFEGVATYLFEVPFGNVDRLNATAIYDGSRTRWNAELTEETGVEVSPLSLLIAFFMSDVGIIIIIAFVLLGIVAAGYNKVVKPKKKAAKSGLENQLQMFKDLETVQHFMAVYLDRGTCVFYHPFTEHRIQPDLISGFIAAITSVYGEIKGDGVRGTLEEIQYQGLRLNSYSGKYCIGILILGGEMTPLLRERLQFFVELFENQYDHDLDGWTGIVDCFDPEWVVSTLNSAFNYEWHLQHKFGPTQKVSKADAKILDYVGAVRDERNEFFIKNLLVPLSEMLDKTEAQVLDRLLSLQDRGVIVPIGIQTILQRQGLALVNGADEMLKPDEAEPVEELEYEMAEEPSEEEKEVEPMEEPSPETEKDSMEAFVQDVESILTDKAETDKEDSKNNEE